MVEGIARAGRLTTAAELLNMPDDGWRYELVRGELLTMPPAGLHHGEYASNIHGPLAVYARANNLGQTYIAGAGFLLGSDPDTVRVPDLSFIRRARLEALRDVAGFCPGPPDLAVEVVSPSDRLAAVQEKVDQWLAAGAGMVVVVNPRPNARTVTVHQPGQAPLTLTEADTLDGGEVVPGWQLPVREIFS